MQNKAGWGNAVAHKSGIPYYGGKYNMLQHILPLIPPHVSYLEPFCGGGTVLFNKPQSKVETINDLDSGLMHLYYCLKHAGPEIVAHVEKLPHSEKLFYTWRDELKPMQFDTVSALKPPTEEDIRYAVMRVYVMRCSMLGKSDQFHFCIGEPGGGRPICAFRSIPNILSSLAYRLASVQLVNCDAFRLLKLATDPDLFVYIDPPYVDTICGDGDVYKGFNHEDMQRLVDWCEAATCKWMLSNFSQILDKYPALKQFEVRTFVKNKSASGITSTSDTSKKTKEEVIIMNYQPPTAKLF